MSVANLEPYGLSDDKSIMLAKSFIEPCPIPELQPSKKRPRPSVLRSRLPLLSLRADFTHEPDAIMQALYRSVNRTWEAYTEGSVHPTEFMRTPFGAPYQIVSIQGKGRGIVASRDIKCGEVILQETPVIVAPHETTNSMIFLLLPQQALQAILLLHNAHPEIKTFSSQEDTPLHQLLDELMGIMSTNSFGGNGPYGTIGVLLLKGSLFNHAEQPNMVRIWDPEKEMMFFVSSREIRKGEELCVDYQPNLTGAARKKKLQEYGI